jgi:hypothetical protein
MCPCTSAYWLVSPSDTRRWLTVSCDVNRCSLRLSCCFKLEYRDRGIHADPWRSGGREMKSAGLRGIQRKKMIRESGYSSGGSPAVAHIGYGSCQDVDLSPWDVQIFERVVHGAELFECRMRSSELIESVQLEQ